MLIKKLIIMSESSNLFNILYLTNHLIRMVIHNHPKKTNNIEKYNVNHYI
jgi:hypothetical protein